MLTGEMSIAISLMRRCEIARRYDDEAGWKNVTVRRVGRRTRPEWMPGSAGRISSESHIHRASFVFTMTEHDGGKVTDGRD